MTTEEIGTVLRISVATVGRELRIGQAWLRRKLSRGFRMTSGTKIDRWKPIQDIFQNALELPASQRGDYLARACGEDADLRSEVTSLLANDRIDTRTTIA